MGKKFALSGHPGYNAQRHEKKGITRIERG
jgi:hypothetical protein